MPPEILLVKRLSELEMCLLDTHMAMRTTLQRESHQLELKLQLGQISQETYDSMIVRLDNDIQKINAEIKTIRNSPNS
jgi:hypothetical protein